VTVLFCYNKYYQGREELGTTSSWEILWRESLFNYYKDKYTEFNPDVYGPGTSSESDEALLEFIRKNGTSMVVMINHKGLNWNRDFISIETLRMIKSRGVKIVAIWGDLQFPTERARLAKIDPFIDVNVCTSSDAIVKRIRFNGSKIYTYVPLAETRLHSESMCTCGARVSYAGSAKGKRHSNLKYLDAHGIKTHIGGGEGHASLSRFEYLKIIAHPISISFANSRIEPCVNARTFEVLSQGGMLMEEWSRETAKFLIPYKHYIPWRSKRELLRMVEYFSSHPEKRKAIADAGYRKYQEIIKNPVWLLVDQVIDSRAVNNYSIAGNINFNEISQIRRLEALFLDFVSQSPKFEYFFVKHFGFRSEVLPRINRFWELLFPNPVNLLFHVSSRYLSRKRNSSSLLE
jgi:hypothetical protein